MRINAVMPSNTFETDAGLLMHRHGDKGREMKLVVFQEYVEAAEKLITENPLNYKRIGFISSEDQDVINDAGNLTRIDTGSTTQLCRCCPPKETPPLR